MSGKFELTGELARFEQQLQQVRLPDSQLNRDQVIYRSGWAAAQAVSGSQRNRAQLPWKISTGFLAAVAALLAIALFGNWQSADAPGLTVVDRDVENTDLKQHVNHHDSSKSVPSPGDGRSSFPDFPFDLALTDDRGGLLTVRGLVRLTGQETMVNANTGDFESLPETKNMRQLMHELVPESQWRKPDRRESILDWFSVPTGKAT